MKHAINKVQGLWGLLLLVAVTACGPTEHALKVLPDGSRAAVIKGAAPPEAPPTAEFAALKLADYERLLGGIRVRMSTWVSLVRSLPKPLLSEVQVQRFAQLAVEELPRLKSGERLKLVRRSRAARSGNHSHVVAWSAGVRSAMWR